MRPMHTHRYVERLVDLLDPSLNRLHGLDLDEARRRVLSGAPAAVRAIDGSFAIVAKDGITIRMARSLDRPMRYFLAKRQEGPALFVADRIDTLHRALQGEGLAGQFHPSYTRMVPAHHVVETVAPWFARRHGANRWALLSPERSVYWDGRKLHYALGTQPPLSSLAADSDWFERWHSVFHPAKPVAVV